MKKSLFAILSLVLLVALSAAVLPCDAVANAAYAPHKQQCDGYTVYEITDNGKTIGARMSGEFFGGMDVVAEVYGKVDFWLFDENLTDEQKQISAKICDTYEKIADISRKIGGYCDTLPSDTYSDIVRYNNAAAGETVQVSATTYDMLVLAKEMYNATGGKYNPALFALVDLWGFSPRFTDGVYNRYPQAYDRVYDYANGSYPLPEDKYVCAFSDKDYIDFAAVVLSADGAYCVTKPTATATVDGVTYTQQIDLGGIAKGYLCDLAQQILAENDIADYYLSVGDSSAAFGTYIGGTYNIGVTDPYRPSTTLGTLACADGKLSTSGLYRRCYTVDGQRYAHIIDGKSGAPANYYAESVTVVAPLDGYSAAVADCLTTALSLMTANELVDFVNGYAAENGLTVIVAAKSTDGRKQLLTNAEESMLTDDSSDYALVLKRNGDKFVLDENALSADDMAKTSHNTVIAVVCTAFAVLTVVSVSFCVVSYVKRRKNDGENDRSFANEKAFKRGDITVYFAVAAVIVLLFAVFARPVGDNSVATVKAVDMASGKTIFAYDVARNKYETFDDDVWQISVTTSDNSVTVTASKTVDGQQRHNTFVITRGEQTAVQMTDSTCGAHKDCVNVFGTLSVKNGSIVCSPNMIKVVTE